MIKLWSKYLTLVEIEPALFANVNNACASLAAKNSAGVRCYRLR